MSHRDPWWWIALNIAWAPILALVIPLTLLAEVLQWCAFRIEDATWGWRDRVKAWHRSSTRGISK